MERGRARRATAAALVAGAALLVAWPWATGLRGVLGLDRGNYAARVFVFARAWERGDPLPEVTRWAGAGEPFVLFNGSLASCAAGGLAALLGAAGLGAEAATALALRAAWVACDALAVLLAFLGLRLAGVGRAGALVGALAWGLVWPRRGESIHAANLEHAAFLALVPLAAGLVGRLVRRPARWRRPAAALAVVLAALVPIHPGLAVIFGAQVALAAAAALIARRRAPAHAPRRSLGPLLLAAALGAAGSLWFWGRLLATRHAFMDPGPSRAEPEATLLDYLDRSLWFADPGGTRLALSPDNYLSSAYLGVTVVALGLLGAALPPVRRRAAAALSLGLGSALVSLHPDWTTAVFGPIHGLSAIRFAAPAAFWTCAAAALGADALARALAPRLGPRGRPLHVAAALGVAVAADLLTLTAGTGRLYAPETSPAHPVCAGYAIDLAPTWDDLARRPAGAGFERVLQVPALELHEGPIVHGRPALDGLERHGWRPGARDGLWRARDLVERAVTGALAPDDPPLGPLLDRLGVRWVVVLATDVPLPARLPGLVRVARGEVVALYERAQDRPVAPRAVEVLEEHDERVRLRLGDGPAGPLEVARQAHPRLVARWTGSDGQTRPLDAAESDLGLVTVALPPGPGELTLTLEPWSGAAPSGIVAALAALVVLVLAVDRQRPSGARPA